MNISQMTFHLCDIDEMPILYITEALCLDNICTYYKRIVNQADTITTARAALLKDFAKTITL